MRRLSPSVGVSAVPPVFWGGWRGEGGELEGGGVRRRTEERAPSNCPATSRGGGGGFWRGFGPSQLGKFLRPETLVYDLDNNFRRGVTGRRRRGRRRRLHLRRDAVAGAMREGRHC